jgi:hypothetical protein
VTTTGRTPVATAVIGPRGHALAAVIMAAPDTDTSTTRANDALAYLPAIRRRRPTSCAAHTKR